MKRKHIKEVIEETTFPSEDSISDERENKFENKSKAKKKKLKLNDRKLYKPPTADELNNLNEAETLFHSSLFKLQTSELLKEVQVKSKWKVQFEKWLTNFNELLMKIPLSEVYDINDEEWADNLNVNIPLCLQDGNLDVHGVFKFVPPSEIEIDAAYKLNMSLGPITTVEIVLEVPKDCWQNGDSLNHRYLRKRAKYLAYIAGHIRNTELVEEVSYQYINDDEKRPTISIKPSGKAGKHFQVILIPVPSKSSFKLNRFIPQRNNIRPSWFFGNEDISEDVPTPHYNLSILKDLTLKDLNNMFLKELKDSEGIRDGILLLKIWLHQRNLLSSLNFTFLSLLIFYLLKMRKISMLMSSYQVLRSVFVTLSQSNWNEKGLRLSEENDQKNLPSLEDFHNYFDVVFIDPSGYFNVCGDLTEGVYLYVKHEASLALELFNSNSASSFESLFMTPVSFHMKFDNLIHLSNKNEFNKALNKFDLKQGLLDNSGNVPKTLQTKLYNILKQGIGQRAHFITPKPSISNIRWKTTVKPPPGNHILTFGILLNPDVSSSVLEKGPPANTPEASEFQEFWGEKSDLRRFQDGTICEAVLWQADSLAGQRNIMEQIVKYLLKKFFGILSVKYSNSQLDSLLIIPNIRFPREFHIYGTGEEASLAVIRSFDSLSKQLRKLEHLPLPVSGIKGISPVFRYTEVFPALPINFKAKQLKNGCAIVNSKSASCPPFVPVNEAVIQMEGSGKWPDDLKALQRVKAAFYIKLAELLSTQYYLTTNASTNCVDVIKDGYVFRLIIACQKEITLMRQYKTSDGMIKSSITEESLNLECKTDLQAQLTSSLHGLQQQYVLYSSVSRLAKRWVSAQLLSSHFPEIVVELLVAYLFVSPHPYTPPCSSISGFLRFLSLLVTFDWKTNALILNLNDKFTNEEVTEMQTWFTTNRTTLPPLCLITPYEKHRSIWSHKSPTGSILHRIVLLAKLSLTQLGTQINLSEKEKVDYKMIFRPPLEVFDVMIHLKNEQNPKLHFSIDQVEGVKTPVCENYLRSADEALPVVNYDPTSFYLRDLKAMYDQFALFFHDYYGGNYIGVVWKPNAFEAKPFKVTSAIGRKPTSASMDNCTAMVPNVENILEDFALLGSGLVRCIKTKSGKWSLY